MKKFLGGEEEGIKGPMNFVQPCNENKVCFKMHFKQISVLRRFFFNGKLSHQGLTQPILKENSVDPSTPSMRKVDDGGNEK